jgi:RHS repeat-associated protein
VDTVAEGWSISSHHHSVQYANYVEKGSGQIIGNYNQGKLKLIAGGGRYNEDGHNARETKIEVSAFSDIEISSDGSIYFVDNHRTIRRIGPDNIVSTVVGNGLRAGNVGENDGELATSVPTQHIGGIEIGADDTIYYLENTSRQGRDPAAIRHVKNDGRLETVAMLIEGPGEDISPFDISLSSDGSFYVVHYLNSNRSLYRVLPDGITEEVINYGRTGSTWHIGINIHPDGTIYILDSYGNKIITVDASGNMKTINLSFQPRGIDWDSRGNAYIGSNYYSLPTNGIHIYTPDGAVQQISGTPENPGPYDNALIGNVSIPWVGLLAYSEKHGGLIVPTGNRIWLVLFNSPGNIQIGPNEWLVIDTNGQTGYTFNSKGQHLRTVDVHSGVTLLTFSYTEDKLTAITDRFGNITRINRDGSGTARSIVSPDGLTTGLAVDSNNRLTRVTYPDQSFYDFEYTDGALMTAKIDPNGNRFELAYDENGRLTDVYNQEAGHWNYTRSTLANGATRYETLSAEGNTTSFEDATTYSGNYTSTITSPSGAEKIYTSTSHGRDITQVLPCDMDYTSSYGYDPEYSFKYMDEATVQTPAGRRLVYTTERSYEDTDDDERPDRVTETTTVNTKSTTVVNDTLAGTQTLTSPEQRVATRTYDPATLLTQRVSVPGFLDTSYSYDSRGRLTSMTTGSRVTSASYNGAGFVDHIIDPANRRTDYAYDPVGRITSITRPDTSVLRFDYDSGGNLTVLTTPATINHGFGYNKVNDQSSYTTPLSGSYQYIYDKEKKLTEINYPSGQQITNTYENSRLARITTPEGAIDFSYLCGDTVSTISSSSETISFGYDGTLPTSETFSGTLNQTLSATYNNDFNLVDFGYAGQTVTHSYDDDGLLTGAGGFTISRNDNNGLPETVTDGALQIDRAFTGYGEIDGVDLTSTHNYDDDGLFTGAGGFTMSRNNDNGLPESVADSTLLLGRAFTGYGEIGGVNLTVNDSDLVSWNLTRDDMGRITAKSQTIGETTTAYTYTYDPVGRLLTVTRDGSVVEEYRYNSRGVRERETNTLRGIDNRTISYSNEDHLISDGSTSYQYDLDGFLIEKTDGSGTTSYDYSSRGELLSVTLPDTTLIEYSYDPLGRRLAKKIDGVIVEKYLWQGLTRLLAVYDGNDSLLHRFDYADGRMPVSMSSGGATYYLAYNQVGSLLAVIDTTGAIIKQLDYDSFGAILSDTNPAFAMPLGFAGGLHDRDTGLVHFGYREYDPAIGRWSAKDPIFFAGGDDDLYGYVQQDPVNLIDPDGRLYTISYPESHAGGQSHIHWGRGNNPRCRGGAINRDGTVRHGPYPPRRVIRMINRRYNWGL